MMCVRWRRSKEFADRKRAGQCLCGEGRRTNDAWRVVAATARQERGKREASTAENLRVRGDEVKPTKRARAPCVQPIADYDRERSRVRSATG